MENLNILLKATLDVENSVKNINDKIKDIQKGLKDVNISLNIDDLKNQFKEVFGEMADRAKKESEKAADEVEKAFKTLNFDDSFKGVISDKGINDFKQKIQDIKGDLKEIENVKINYGKDESGKDIGRIDSVLVQYRDNMNRLVSETMAWADITDKEGDVVEKRWQTISVSVEDNQRKIKNLGQTLDIFKKNMNFKLDLMGDTKKVDTSKLEELRKKINALDTTTDEAKQKMKEYVLEYQRLSSESETLADKEKALIQLRKQQAATFKQMSSTMRYTGIDAKQKEKFNQLYADIEKQIKNIEKANEDVTKSEVEGIRKRIAELLKLVNAEKNYQQQKDKSETTRQKKESMLKQLDDIKLTGMIDSAEIDKVVKDINKIKDNATDASHELRKIDPIIKDMANKSTKDLQTLEKQMKDTFDLQEFKKMQGNKLDLLGDTTADARKIDELRKRLNALTADAPELRQQMKMLGNDIQILGSHSKKTADMMAFLARYFGFSEIIQLSKRAISSMVQEVRNLDTELTELRKVTDFSAEGLDSFTKSAFNAANEIGRTGTEMISASAEFARAGFSEMEISDLAKTSLIMTNIGDGIKDVSEASGYLISVLKAYSLEASKAIDVTSAINEVSNNNAVGFQNLADGLSRTASVYSQAGTSMEELLGLLTGAFEINRNMEKTSSGLITISTRLRSIQMDGEEAVIPIAKLQDQFSKLAGVDIMDKQTGQLRDTYDILKDLSLVWGTLDKNMQESIAFSAAGTRQKSVFLDLMKNFEAVDRAIVSASSSAGSAIKENDVFMDSIEGKLNQLKSAWSELANNTISSDFAKGLIDITKNFVELISKGEMLIPIVVGLGAAFGAIKLLSVLGGIKNLIAAIQTYEFWAKSATLATGALNVALNYLIGAGIVVGIVAIAKAFDAMYVSVEEQTEKVSQLTTAYEELVAKRDELNEVEYKTQAQEEELAIINSMVKAQERLLAIEKEKLALKEYDGKGVSGEGKWGDMVSTKESAEGQIAALEGIKTEYKEMLLEFDEDLLATMTSDDLLVDRMKDIKTSLTKTYSDLLNDLQKANTDLPSFANPADIEAQKEYIKQLEELINLVGVASGLESPYKNLIQEEMGKNIKDVTQATKEQIDAVIASLVARDDSVTSIDKAIDAEQRWRAEIVALYPHMADLYDVTEDLSEATGQITLDNLAQQANDTAADIKLLNQAVNSLNEGQTLTSETIIKLMEAFPELREELILTEKGYTFNKESLINLADQSALSFQNMIDNQRITTNASIQEARSRINAYRIELEELKKLARAQSIFQRIENRNKIIMGYGNLTTDAHYDKLLAEKEKQMNQKIAEEEALIDGYISDLGKLDIVEQNFEVATSGENTKKGSNISNKKPKDAKKDKDDFAKYYSQLIEERINVLMLEGEKLEQAIDFTEAKLKDAVLRGDLDLQNTLEQELVVYTTRQKDLMTKTGEELRKIGNDVRIQLGGMKIKGYENFNFANMNELDVAKINQAFDKAMQGTKDETKANIQVQKDKFNELASVILRIYQDELPQMSKDWWEYHTSATQQSVDSICKSYERQNKVLDENLELLDLEMMMTKEGSEEWLKGQDGKMEVLLEKQRLLYQTISELRAQNLGEENEEIQNLKSLYKQYEKERRQMIKETAESRKKYELELIKTEIDNLEKRKNALETLIDLTMKMLKQEAEAKKKAIKEEVDGYQKIINKKKELLQQEQSERKYGQELTEKQKKVTDLENKLLALQMDNSEKAQAERIKLEQQLAEAKEDLENLQYDKSIEDQENRLDQEFENFQDQKQKELDEIEDFLDKEGQLRLQAIKLIENKNSDLYKKLLAWNKQYGDGLDTTITTAWEDANVAMQAYNEKNLTLLQIMEQITEELRAQNKLRLENESKNWQDYAPEDTSNPVTSEDSVVEQMKTNSQRWKEAKDQTERDRLSQENQRLGKSIGASYDPKTGRWFKNGIPLYHSGGIVGDSSATKSTEQLALLLKGEIVSTPKQAEQFLTKILPNLLSAQTSKVELKIENMIAVEKMDNSTDVESIVDRAVSQTMKTINETMRRKGFGRNALSFSI